LVEFLHPDRRSSKVDGGDRGPGSFDLLGFTHYWGKARSGKWIVKRKTAKDRFRRALSRVAQWCREQQKALGQKLRGHYGYYGITRNFRAITLFCRETIALWRRWLNRRSQRRHMPWERMHRLLDRRAGCVNCARPDPRGAGEDSLLGLPDVRQASRRRRSTSSCRGGPTSRPLPRKTHGSSPCSPSTRTRHVTICSLRTNSR
jgi:hypothetical protein